MLEQVIKDVGTETFEAFSGMDRLLGRKVMTNLDSIFKSRDITLPTKVRLVKAMVFPSIRHIQSCMDVRVGL